MSTYSNLKIELIGTGEQTGLWGATTNVNIGTAVEQAIVGMATLDSGDFSTNVATLTLANTNAAQDARALCLTIASGAVSAAGTINVPAIEKPYIVINNASFAVTIKVSGQTGVTVPAGRRSVVYNNGTDVGEQITYLTNLTIGTLSLASALPVASGGTGATAASGARTNLGLVIGTDVPSPTGTGASGSWNINAATATSATSATNATNAANLVTTNFSMLEEGGKLVIKNGSTVIASFSAAGAFIAKDNVTGYGTP
jgi:hypothetical protein